MGSVARQLNDIMRRDNSEPADLDDAYRRLTKRQKDVAVVIIDHYLRHDCLPTARYLCDSLGWKSCNSHTHYMEVLCNKMFLERTKSGYRFRPGVIASIRNMALPRDRRLTSGE